jgi:hypothetical protein
MSWCALYLIKRALGPDPASMARLGRSALLSKLRLGSWRMPHSRTPEELSRAVNSIGALAARPEVEFTPAGQGLIGAGMKGFDLSDWMRSAGRESAPLRRIGPALKALMGEGRPFVP